MFQIELFQRIRNNITSKCLYDIKQMHLFRETTQFTYTLYNIYFTYYIYLREMSGHLLYKRKSSCLEMVSSDTMAFYILFIQCT